MVRLLGVIVALRLVRDAAIMRRSLMLQAAGNLQAAELLSRL